MDPKRKKARAPVSTLARSHRPEFFLEGRLYALKNLSLEGVAFSCTENLVEKCKSKKNIDAKLILNEKTCDCSLQFIHWTVGIAGFKFSHLPEGTLMEIAQLLEPSVLASFLSPNEEHLKFDSKMNEKKLCYSGLNNSLIRVWFKEELGLIVAIEIHYKSWILFREFQHKTRLQNQSGLSTREDEINREIGQFLASAPLPIPGILLWQFLEMGEQIFLPKSVQSSHKAA